MCKLIECICGKSINHDQPNGKCDACTIKAKKQEVERSRISSFKENKNNKKKKNKPRKLENLEKIAELVEE